MISIKQRKIITSLQQKKQRVKNGLFLAEGEKTVGDLLQQKQLNEDNLLLICASKDWIDSNSKLLRNVIEKVEEVDNAEMKKLSSMVTAPGVLALIRIPERDFNKEVLRTDYTLVLDSVRDPGNLGTIIRTADWFGIKNIICSSDSVDQYNSKVVQASMGAIMRVNVFYEELSGIFEQASRLKIPIYGATMDGQDFFDLPIKNPGLIVFGNESSGISKDLETFFKDKIRIPDFQQATGTESLNVGISVAIVCSELRRRQR